MMRSLWIAKTGMEGHQTKLDVISNNLANVGTNGFKRAAAQFEDLNYQTLRQSGAASTEGTQLPIGLEVGLGVRVSGTSRNFSQGNLQQTGNSYDVAIQGNGFFQIEMPDGSTGYTRDGAFQVDSNGQLVTKQGYPVQPGITIPQDAKTVTVANDGTVQVTTAGNAQPTTLGQLQLANFVNPAGLHSLGQNLYAETAASGTPNTGNPGSNELGSLMQGAVETSNVNVVEELVNMIATQRAYEMNSKAIQTADQMLQKVAQL